MRHRVAKAQRHKGEVRKFWSGRIWRLLNPQNEFKISSSGNLPESELRDGIPHYRNFKDGTPAPLPA
jgi:hypothetical protein